MPPEAYRYEPRERAPRIAPLVACLALSLAAVAPAWGVKWTTGCPKAREKLYGASSVYGIRTYATSTFVSVGHEVTFRLRESSIAQSGGGFSTAPGGNTIEMTFLPIEGDPIPIPPFTATAVGATTLRFVVPDTTPLLGRMLVGPVQYVVKRGDTVLVDTYKRRFPLVIPPPADVAALATAGGEAEAYAAMDRKGRIWIPLGFGGFGETLPPECPALMTPITTLAVDLKLKKKDGGLLPHANFATLKNGRFFLGDFTLFGVNLYGLKLKGAPDVKHVPGGAVLLCAVNDSIDLVMMLPLVKAAQTPGSDILTIVRDGSAIPLRFRNVAGDVDVAPHLASIEEDSLRQPCVIP